MPKAIIFLFIVFLYPNFYCSIGAIYFILEVPGSSPRHFFLQNVLLLLDSKKVLSEVSVETCNYKRDKGVFRIFKGLED